MQQGRLPEFIASTLPPPQQWRGRSIWRSDLGYAQSSDGLQWLPVGALSAAQVAAVAFASIAAADIQTTEGAALGESREIADGDDAGARLIWRVPQGQTEPAWCWWVWPQSRYEGA